MEEAYHNLIWAVLITVTYLNNTCNFLLYVLTAGTFREQLVALFTRKRPSVMRTWGGSSRETVPTIQLDTCSVSRKWKSVCYHVVWVPSFMFFQNKKNKRESFSCGCGCSLILLYILKKPGNFREYICTFCFMNNYRNPLDRKKFISPYYFRKNPSLPTKVKPPHSVGVQPACFVYGQLQDSCSQRPKVKVKQYNKLDQLIC